VEGVLAHRIVDDGYAASTRELADLQREVRVTNEDVRIAVLAREGGFFFGADHADRPRTERLQPLAENRPDTARSGEYEDAVARAHFIGTANQVLGRHALRQYGGGRCIADVVGQRHQPSGNHVARVGIGTQSGVRVGNSRSDGELDAFTHGVHDGGRFHTEHRWQLHRIEPATLVAIDEVHADGRMAYAHFAARGRSQLHFGKLQHVGATCGLNANDSCHAESMPV
jgi:hypothetical protein